ncbi:RsmB/NOP family class I SAM-dependent RNA methyltransferase [Thalassolituus sp. C2-1]|uniref:RsmB/NOP family class I SAM-dependent RNA methyltransferase n=1 Tax=Venatorbacter sp. C2-1 TaxID=2597518 RepID=UPI001194E84C|nr:RsmB/NOP family class I SAM-dependent RNA methyltransferase [Thalassolituus sp. C2-1]TVV43000.1 RsmB/NOP family class I SAM-dependent RNA methyltransferase [Thalassolituus sp. C2-1]
MRKSHGPAKNSGSTFGKSKQRPAKSQSSRPPQKQRQSRAASGSANGRRGSGDEARIIQLWSQWQSQAVKPPLDRWLRGQLRAPRQADSADNSRALSEAMFSALRFQQLACALEDMLNERNGVSASHAAEHDWQSWDEQWQPAAADTMHPSAFWYWIQLRSLQPWNFVRMVRQDEQRAHLFASIEHQVKAKPLSPLALLWHGVRPSFLPLLQQRAKRSQWSDSDLQRFLQMQNGFPPLWLRINDLRLNELPADARELKALQLRLQEEGVSAQLRDDHLCASGGRGVNSSELYRNGVIEIQDLASQQIAAALDARPGDKIWDACAGAGGKTLALAAKMNNKGAVVATDLHQHKLDELKRRASRAGARNVRTFLWDAAAPLRLPQEIARQQGFDKVLVDAPCSSAGTWRRNPDARWRFNSADSSELQQIQLNILTQAAPAVRPDGMLVYATCSWQVSENEDIVSAFLQANPAFSLQSQQMLGAPEDDCDCMFVAVMKKAGS